MGGDEVFYGYSKHSFIYTKRKQYALPDSIKKCWSTIKNGVRTRKDLSTFDALINVKPYEVYPAIKNSHCLEWIRSVPGYKSWVQNEFENSEAPEHFVPRYELSTVIQNSHLPAFDHGSMRAGFELRTPFLSRSLVKTVSRIAPERLLAFGQKEPLRRLLHRYVPDNLIEKRKLGFINPSDQFTQGVDFTTFHIPGLDADLIRRAWNNRTTNKAYSRICTRLLLLNTFFKTHGVN
ncbi:hypothetical protein JCM12178A_08070 [Salidesulfovibrio brasiliensis]